ncbi:DnaD domain-containing protein [Tumebacillus flagellatus]|uniref:DnaB/C C-terminal domain-containing protein n=1 Tax=Tumebacillus flagellatus TaxID=1157490 RepID=A0A074LLS6_9BACL|nr:DnaD domain protein [Tumebacillus flagellatus]KEO80838.1 hypothetical protein EL26_24135 [Tumebacillus flagellatus]
MQGWIKLHRKLQESPIFQDPYIFKLWTLCLMKAAHKPTTVLVERQMVELKAGQFVTGRKVLCQEFNSGAKKSDQVPESTLWSWLKKLETWGNLDIKANNKFSVVTVVKWEFYQGSDAEPDNGFDHNLTTDCPQTDSSLTATCPQADTNKNEKNLEKKDLPLPPPPTRTRADEEQEMLQVIVREFGAEGLRFSDFDRDEINAWIDDDGHAPALITRALKEAVLHKKLSTPYMAKILKDWKKNGWTTPEQVDAGKEKQHVQSQSQHRRSGSKIVSLPEMRQTPMTAAERFKAGQK